MPCARPASGRRLQRVAASLLGAFLLMTLLAVPCVRAQGIDASYRVRDVAVEATAANAVEAREQAIAQGQRQALRRLLERLTTDGATLANVDQLPVEDLVASLEVLDETVGPQSYAATLEVAFDREAVEDVLQDRGVAYVDAAAEPVTLVPLWETGTGLRLWGSENAWKAAWDRALEPDALAPFVVPLGDLQDLSLLNPDQAARGDRGPILDLAERYGTDTAVVARLQGSGAPGSQLEIAARRYGEGGGEPYRTVVRRGPEEPLAESLERAVREMQAAYDARFREQRVVAGGPTEPLVVTTAIDSLAGWGRVVRLLEGVGEVERAQVRRFTRNEATIALRVSGGAERLQERLRQEGWALTGDAGAYRLARDASGGVSAF